MSVRGILLVLLVLTCFQLAESGKGPTQCCWDYQTKRIPLQAIKMYAVTELQCTNPGVIFTTKRDVELCADPRVEWVQKLMDQYNQRLSRTDD